jgi:hypothetical protein
MKQSRLLEEIIKKSINTKNISESNVQTKISYIKLRKNLDEAIKSKQKLVEYVNRSRAEIEPGYVPKKPWTNIKAETMLKQFEGKPFSVGMNPHGYEIDTADDRLWFYHDGSVRSTTMSRNLGYTIDPSKREIILWNSESGPSGDDAFEIGRLQLPTSPGGLPKFVESEANIEKKSAETEEEDSSWLDWLQTALDWIGLVPGIGDAIDVINAAIYFARGKYFEGFLSLLAVIPVVGSVVSLGLKKIFKVVGLTKVTQLLIASFKKAKSTDELWDYIIKTGDLKKADLEYLGPGMKNFANALESTYPYIESVPLVDGKTIVKELEVFEDWLRASSKSIDDLASATAKAAEKNADKIAFKAAPKVAEKTFLRKFGNGITFNLIPKLKQLPWFPAEKLQKIATGLENRFVKDMAKDPSKLTAILRTAPDREKLLANMIPDMRNRFSKLPPASRKSLQTGLEKRGLAKNGKLNLNTPDDWDEYLWYLKSRPELKGAYDAAAKQIADHAKTSNSFAWSIYKNDRLNNLKTVLSSDMIPNGSSWYKELDFTFRKNADIIWNEMQDIGEDFGVKSEDEVNGVIWPIIKSAISNLSPGTYEAISGVGEKIKKSYVYQTAKQAVVGDEQEENPYTADTERLKGSYK